MTWEIQPLAFCPGTKWTLQQNILSFPSLSGPASLRAFETHTFVCSQPLSPPLIASCVSWAGIVWARSKMSLAEP